MARFLGHIVTFTLLLNLLLLVDLFLLKRLAAEASGLSGSAAADAASQAAGYYAAAQTLARIPYQGILAVAFVIFPLMSRATFDHDRETAATYVRATLRFSLLFCGALAVVFEANPEAVLAVPYPPVYTRAGNTLALLAPAQLGFSLFAIACTILNGAGQTRMALALVAGTVTVSVVSCVLSARALGPSLGVENAVAASVLGANALGAVVAIGVLWRSFGAGLPVATSVRATVAFAMATAVGRFLPDGSKLQTLGECLLVVCVFGLVLVLSGEISRADRERLRRIFARRNTDG